MLLSLWLLGPLRLSFHLASPRSWFKAEKLMMRYKWLAKHIRVLRNVSEIYALVKLNDLTYQTFEEFYHFTG